MIAWRRDCEHITPFLALPDELSRVVYTTDTIEAMHRQIRKAIKPRGHFPDEQAATKLIYLAIERAETKWRSAAPGHPHSQPSRSTSETDTPTDSEPSRPGLPHRSSDTLHARGVAAVLGLELLELQAPVDRASRPAFR